MSNTNGNLGLSPALKAIREQCRKPDENRLVEMRNDQNGLREFLLGGVRADGIWPAGTISVRVADDELLVTLSIYSLEIEAKYRGTALDRMLLQIDTDLEQKSVRWQLDYRGRERLERRVSQS